MSRLEWVAQDMRSAAISAGSARRDLARGLRLELSVDFESAPDSPDLDLLQIDQVEAPVWWSLRLSRPIGDPSEAEVAIVRSAFGVPAGFGAEPVPGGMVIRWPMS